MKLLVPLSALLIALGACSERTIAPPDGDGTIPFELVVPGLPAADYLAISGIRTVTDEVIIDTVEYRTGRDLFAQFTVAPGFGIPPRVELNDNMLDRSGTTDTLRLSFAVGSDLYGIHRWELTDSLGTPDVFSVAPVDILDSVSPFLEQQPIRADTSLTLRWKPPISASNGVMVTWRAPGVYTYRQIALDVGRVTIPADSVLRFRGEEGELILTRFKASRLETVRRRSIQILRVAQRNYKTRVTG